jgi:hypothetical protein
MAKLTATNATYGINITKEFPINVETPVALKISSEPLKTTYQPGDTFDKAGLGVAFLYEDGKTAILDESDYTARANLSAPGDAKVNIKCSIEGLDDLKLDENYTVKVEGEVANTDGSSQTSATRRPTTGDKDKSEGISPVIIVVIIVAVLAVAGVAVVLVVLKKKKK